MIEEAEYLLAEIEHDRAIKSAEEDRLLDEQISLASQEFEILDLALTDQSNNSYF